MLPLMLAAVLLLPVCLSHPKEGRSLSLMAVWDKCQMVCKNTFVKRRKRNHRRSIPLFHCLSP